MTNLAITLEKRERLTNMPVAVEILDHSMNTVWSGSVRIGQTKVVAVPRPGTYAVQLELPSGKRLTKRSEVKRNQTAKVTLRPVTWSPRESLEWAAISKPTVLESKRMGADQLRSIWLRLWARSPDGSWTVQPWPTQLPDREDDLALVQYSFYFRSMSRFGLYYLQIGGPSMPWRFVSLPADDIHVLITGIDGPGEHKPPVDVSVASIAHEGEALLGYMRSGEIEKGRLVAEELLRDKVNNPTTAAIAAYFLLRSRGFEKFQQWAANLANWMQWLPDGPVIDAWYILRSARPDPKRARQRLLEAIERGIPVYASGLRLLIDGLAMMAADKTLCSRAVERALERVRKYGAAADWEEPTTTFVGEDPETPGKIRVGNPDDPEHVVFLAAVQDVDLRWKGLTPDVRASHGVTATHTSRTVARGEELESTSLARGRSRARSARTTKRVSASLGAPKGHEQSFAFSDVGLTQPSAVDLYVDPRDPLARVTGSGMLSSDVAARRVVAFAHSGATSSAKRGIAAKKGDPEVQALLQSARSVSRTGLAPLVQQLAVQEASRARFAGPKAIAAKMSKRGTRHRGTGRSGRPSL